MAFQVLVFYGVLYCEFPFRHQSKTLLKGYYYYYLDLSLLISYWMESGVFWFVRCFLPDKFMGPRHENIRPLIIV